MNSPIVQLRCRRRGTVLVVAMIIIFALASMVIVLNRSMRVELRAASNRAARTEAVAIARGAEQYVLAMLAESVDPVEMYDSQAFVAIPVGAGHFWLVRPDWGDPQLPRFGLLDESSKLNLNVHDFETLRALPGMDDTIAGAIIDWRDPDDETSPSGAESNVYLRLDPPYQAKNAPFESVEELLMVNGMTEELLFGPPAVIAEDGFGFSGSLAGEYYLTHGLADFFSAQATDWALNPDDEPRLDVNDQNGRENLRTMLNTQLGEPRGQEVASRLQDRTYQGMFDFARRVELTAQELETIEPYITFGNNARRRINVNTAPREVLEALEFLDASQVNALLARRASAVANNPTSAAWVLDTIDPTALSDIGDRFTGRGGVYSADIVAMSGDGRGVARVRIIVDATTTSPRIVYRRDLTDRGLPIDRESLAATRTGILR